MKFNFVTLALLFSVNAMAADCVITTTRTACPGKEKESYSKCEDGAQTCSKTLASDSEAECKASALAACKNDRTTITKYKKVTATFSGKDFAKGLDFCDKDAGEYSVKANFPFRNSAKCE